MQSPPVINVDFNEVYDDDYVWAVIRDESPLNPSPQVNDWVVLRDADGITCWAIVIGRTPRTIDCKIDWSTWKSVRVDADNFYGAYRPAS